MPLLEQLLPILLALTLAVLVELAIPRTSYPLRNRLPGLWFIIALPMFAYLIGRLLEALVVFTHLRPFFSLTTLPTWLGIAIAVILIDFFSYWEHRFEHRFWWPVHAVHHASRDVHAASNFGHPIQAVGEAAVIAMPLFLLGFSTFEIPFGVTVYRTLHSMFNHAPVKAHLGLLRRVFSDNRYHRIHHSMEERHFDRNFGTIFTLWDQVFGTAYFPAHDEWPETGVAGLDPPRTMREYLAYPVRYFGPNREVANG